MGLNLCCLDMSAINAKSRVSLVVEGSCLIQSSTHIQLSFGADCRVLIPCMQVVDPRSFRVLVLLVSIHSTLGATLVHEGDMVPLQACPSGVPRLGIVDLEATQRSLLRDAQKELEIYIVRNPRVDCVLDFWGLFLWSSSLDAIRSLSGFLRISNGLRQQTPASPYSLRLAVETLGNLALFLSGNVSKREGRCRRTSAASRSLFLLTFFLGLVGLASPGAKTSSGRS